MAEHSIGTATHVVDHELDFVLHVPLWLRHSGTRSHPTSLQIGGSMRTLIWWTIGLIVFVAAIVTVTFFAAQPLKAVADVLS